VAVVSEEKAAIFSGTAPVRLVERDGAERVKESKEPELD
jgi:hypothetical protein